MWVADSMLPSSWAISDYTSSSISGQWDALSSIIMFNLISSSMTTCAMHHIGSLTLYCCSSSPSLMSTSASLDLWVNSQSQHLTACGALTMWTIRSSTTISTTQDSRVRCSLTLVETSHPMTMKRPNRTEEEKKTWKNLIRKFRKRQLTSDSNCCVC